MINLLKGKKMLKKISLLSVLFLSVILTGCNPSKENITIESLVKHGSIAEASDKISQDELFVVMYDYQINDIKKGRTVEDAIKDFEKKYQTKVLRENVKDYKLLYLRDVASFGGMKLLVEQMPDEVSKSMQFWIEKASADKYLNKETMMKIKLVDFIEHCKKVYGYNPAIQKK